MAMGTMKMKHIALLAALLLPGGCVDYNDDAPEVDPFQPGEIVSVDRLKSLYTAELARPAAERSPVRITNNWSLAGLVTATDKQDGNLFREGIVEDVTGGLLMKFMSTGGLNIGDSIIVNVRGLWLGDYGNFTELGDEPFTDTAGVKRVSGFNKDKRILRYSIDNPARAAVKTIQEARTNAMAGRLVTLQQVQFADSELGKTWADTNTSPPAAGNRCLSDCHNNMIIVHTSGYATFAGAILPEGRGDISGVIIVCNDEYKLLVRDFKEVLLTGERCPAGGQPLNSTPVTTGTVR